MTIEEAIKNLDDNLYAGDVNNLSTEALEKALDVLEKVRDGKMIELPCKVGDTVYSIEKQFGCNSEECHICDCQAEFEFHYRYGKCPAVHTIKIVEHKMRTINDIFHWYSYFGKNVFPTKEEAEKALKEW